ncbi:MAG TPA: hypothetical protein PLQ97_06890 [Myxococcota bacterium]|nr:hypothetical protein [Myxococcota bacterium]HQK50668.1 hypothetical protein [Myxococcota bacterium]
MNRLLHGSAWSLVILLACGGGGGGGGSDNGGDYGDVNGWTIETTLSAETIEAGGTVEVTCVAQGAPTGTEVAFEVQVDPAAGCTVSGLQLTCGQAGTYQIACAGAGLEDETPATLTVEAGRPLSVETAVAPATIPAGETAHVTCTALDALGNPTAAAFQVQVTPAEGIDLVDRGGGQFDAKGRKAGDYRLACGLIDGAVDQTPAALQVTPGPLALVRTRLDPDTIVAGRDSQGTCLAFDAEGNGVAGLSFRIEVPEALSVTNSPMGFTVTGTKAGQYDVTCHPADDAPATLESARLTIQAGEAAGLRLKLIPEKPAYRVADQVKVGFDLVDAFGNPVPGGAITDPTVDPETGIRRLAADRFAFEAEGRYTFAACVVDDASRCDDIVAWCDGTAPTLAITYPERGATLDGDRLVMVTGIVSEDISQVGQVTINGQPASLGPGGTFQFPMQPNQGMNLIDAVATDTFGNATRVLQSYLYSSTWIPMDQPDVSQSLVPEAVKAWLDDLLFYNPDPADEATISALLVAALTDLDVAALLPSPVTRVEQIGCAYDVFLDKVVFGTPDVKVQSTFGGLQIDAVIPNFRADVRLVNTRGGFPCPGDQSGYAEATKVTLNMRVNLGVDQGTRRIRIFAGETSLTMDGFNLHLDNVFFNFLASILKGTLEGLLKDQVEPLLVKTINDLEPKVNELLEKPFEISVDAPLPGMNNLVLRISLAPRKIDFTPAGGAIDLDGAVTSDHLVDRVILGSIGRASCLALTPEVFGFDLGNARKVMAAIFDDVLNEALYSVWDSRFLHIVLTAEDLASTGTDLSQYGITDLNAVTTPLLPPVFTSCNPAGTLTVQLGDFYLDAQFGLMGQPVDLKAFLFLELTLALAIVDDPEKGPAIQITLNPPDLVDMDIAYLNEEWDGQEDTFRDLLLGAIPVLFQQIADKPFVVAIPSFNLKDLLSGAGLPLQLPDKDLTIVPKDLGHDQGYLHFGADIELR